MSKNSINLEQRIVMLAPMLIGVVGMVASDAIVKFVTAYWSLSTIFSAKVFSTLTVPFNYFQLTPFFVLTLYLSVYVVANRRKASYRKLVGGILGILVVYIPIDIFLIATSGGNANIGGGILLLFRPVIAIFTMALGLFIVKAP